MADPKKAAKSGILSPKEVNMVLCSACPPWNAPGSILECNMLKFAAKSKILPTRDQIWLHKGV